MKKALTLLLCLVFLAMTVVGCSQPAASNENKGLPSDLSQLKIGILHPGSLADGGYNMLAKMAGDAIKEKWGCEVSFVQAPSSDKMKSEAETLANEGYHIIIGHGGEYSAPFGEISDQYPNVYFLTNGGSVVKANQFPINFCTEQATYVGGVVAGLMTKTNKVGWTVGGDSPGFSKTGYTFALGAQSVNPAVTDMNAVLTSIDANEAYETTLSQINSGADFIFSSTDEAQLGALKAVAENPGTYQFGALSDLSAEGPDCIFASALVNFEMGYMAGVQACIDGIAEPDVLWIGLDSGGVQFVWNDALKSKFPAEVVKKAEETIEKIISGEIDVPNEYEYAEIRKNQ